MEQKEFEKELNLIFDKLDGMFEEASEKQLVQLRRLAKEIERIVNVKENDEDEEEDDDEEDEPLLYSWMNNG